MRAKSAVRALAAIALAMLPSAAWAGYCGVARYSGCTPCCYQQHCHTVMKTVRCVEWHKEQVQCCKTVYDRVCEDRVDQLHPLRTRNTSEASLLHRLPPVWETKTRCYTVCKPVWETKTRNVCYTTYHPVWETKTRCYTVCKPVWETKTRNVCYTTYHPVWETKTRCYTVCKPVWETKTRCYTVCKPVWETSTREVPYTVCKPVWETRQRNYTVCKPVWETVNVEVTYYVRKAVPYTKTIPSAAVTGKPRPIRFLARPTPRPSASPAP